MSDFLPQNYIPVGKWWQNNDAV